MKRRIPRKLKKGFRSLLYRRETKWKRKARNIIQKAVEGFALSFFGNGAQLFEPGGIVSDKPVSNRGEGEYVVTKEERQRLEAMLRRESDRGQVRVRKQNRGNVLTRTCPPSDSSKAEKEKNG